MANLKKNKNGYGYKYTDLAEVHNYLEEQEYQYLQYIERIDGDDYIMTKRYINGKWEEEALRGCRVVQATLQGIKNPAQEQGSALTYARRYSLLMAFGLATEDDDAHKLTKKVEEVTTNSNTEYYCTECGIKFTDWTAPNGTKYTAEELWKKRNGLCKKCKGE